MTDKDKSVLVFFDDISIMQTNIDFDDPLTFSLAPPAGPNFYLSSKISQHLLDGLAHI